MKVGDLVKEDSRSRVGIITEIHPRSNNNTFVSVLWSDKNFIMVGYMLAQLRVVDESR